MRSAPGCRCTTPTVRSSSSSRRTGANPQPRVRRHRRPGRPVAVSVAVAGAPYNFVDAQPFGAHPELRHRDPGARERAGPGGGQPPGRRPRGPRWRVPRSLRPADGDPRGRGADRSPAGRVRTTSPPGSGDDTVDGGAGFDRVSTTPTSLSGIDIDLARARAPAGRVSGRGHPRGHRGRHRVAPTTTSSAATTRRTPSTAGHGNDLVEGRGNNDFLTGGPGTDTVSYASATSPVTVDAARTDVQVTGAGSDQFADAFENLVGGQAADSLRGTAGPNVIDGGPGRRHDPALAGDDRLLLRDGAPDTADCGDDLDRAEVDPGGIDGLVGCETVVVGVAPSVLAPGGGAAGGGGTARPAPGGGAPGRPEDPAPRAGRGRREGHLPAALLRRPRERGRDAEERQAGPEGDPEDGPGAPRPPARPCPCASG